MRTFGGTIVESVIFVSLQRVNEEREITRSRWLKIDRNNGRECMALRRRVAVQEAPFNSFKEISARA